jgi:hypothetical protein
MAKNVGGISLLTLSSLMGVWLALSACSTIDSKPQYAAGTARLGAKPDHIYITPFDTETAAWSAGLNMNNFPGNENNGFSGSSLNGTELVEFKRKFQENFDLLLKKRLQNIAPVDTIWNEMPTSGWLIRGEFVRVDQGSRFLRTAVGIGAGRTVLRTRVYVYDLSVSQDKYLLAFETGVPKAEGSGKGPAGITSLMEPITTISSMSSGLSWDAGQTAVAIEEYLSQYQ